MKVSTAYNINLAIPSPTPEEDDLSSSESTRSSGSRTESHTIANTEVSSALSGSGGRTNDASSFAISSAASSLGTGLSQAGSMMSFDDCDSIGQMLLQLEDHDPSLNELVIECKKMDKDAAEEISIMLSSNKHVEKIILKCGANFRSRHRDIFITIVSGLACNSSIKHIEIQGANFTREMASALVPCYIHSKSLQHISMINCVGNLKQLFVAMSRNKRIQQLTFNSCYWEEHNADLLASALPIMNLQSISIVDINIPSNGLPYLFKNIMNCSQLKELDLSRSRLDARSLRLLCSRLAEQRTITKLVLQWCDLNDLHMKELLRGLRDHPSLTCIDISQNILISDIGVVYLVDLISCNSRITELNVSNCGLHPRTLQIIDSGLQYNRSALKIFLSRSVYDIFLGPSTGNDLSFVGNDGTIIEGDCETASKSTAHAQGKVIDFGKKEGNTCTADDTAVANKADTILEEKRGEVDEKTTPRAAEVRDVEPSVDLPLEKGKQETDLSVKEEHVVAVETKEKDGSSSNIIPAEDEIEYSLSIVTEPSIVSCSE